MGNKGRIIRLLVALSLLAATSAFGASVKVAVIESLSGPQASTGLLYRTATRYGIDLINAAGGWNGQKLEFLEYDNQGGTGGAADKLKAAIADGVQIIVQGSSSAVSGQLTEDIRKHNLRNPGKEVLFINVGGEALELTGEKCQFYHFRFCTNSQVRVKTLVVAMKQANVLGTKIYSMNQNYSWGQDMESAIVEDASLGGYQVVGKMLHDVNRIQDFTPYVERVKASGAETVITGNWSNDLLLLMKAAHESGLKARFATCFLDQPGNLANAGMTALGYYVSHPFDIEAAGKEGEQFAADYKAKTGHLPVYIEPQNVFAMSMLQEALKTVKPVNGNLDVTALAKAMEKARIRTSMGEEYMRAADHQVQIPMVVSVVSRDAKYKADGTNMGFKPVKKFTAEEASVPPQASCKMQRPN
jgi:branched-chain amino acid transport system substrate-binding protein